MLTSMLAASIIYMGHPDHGWILGGVEDKIPAIRHCYERARLTNPEADGRRIAVLEVDAQRCDLRVLSSECGPF